VVHSETHFQPGHAAAHRDATAHAYEVTSQLEDAACFRRIQSEACQRRDLQRGRRVLLGNEPPACQSSHERSEARSVAVRPGTGPRGRPHGAVVATVRVPCRWNSCSTKETVGLDQIEALPGLSKGSLEQVDIFVVTAGGQLQIPARQQLERCLHKKSVRVIPDELFCRRLRKTDWRFSHAEGC